MRRTTITKATYIQRQKVIQSRMARHFQPVIQKVLRHYFDQVAGYVRAHGIHGAQGMVHGDTVLPGLYTAIKDLYHTAVQMATKKPVVNTAQEKAFPKWLQIVFGFLDRFLLNKVVLPISQTTIAQVDEILKQGLDEGLGSAEMVKRLEDSALPEWRARMIVRTETVRATNTAQMVQATQNPYETEKMWIAIEDNRTRKSHSHAGVDGERIGLYEKYSNGLYYPGDPTGAAKEVINCRCTQGYFAKRDLNGNLLPKQHQQAELELAKLFN